MKFKKQSNIEWRIIDNGTKNDQTYVKIGSISYHLNVYYNINV